jgi:hypothetical protein
MHISVENLRNRVGQDYNRQKLLLRELVPSWLASIGRRIILRCPKNLARHCEEQYDEATRICLR